MKMVEESYWCDVCGEEIEDIDEIYSVSSKKTKALNLIGIRQFDYGKRITKHICVGCQDSILKHIEDLCQKQTLTDGWEVL